MTWDQGFAIGMMACFTIANWKLNRHYAHTGRIFAVPVPTSRAQWPTLFKVGMVLNWVCFWILMLVSLGLTAAIIHSWG